MKEPIYSIAFEMEDDLKYGYAKVLMELDAEDTLCIRIEEGQTAIVNVPLAIFENQLALLKKRVLK